MEIKEVKIKESKANSIISTYSRVDETIKSFDDYLYDEQNNIIGVKINENLIMNHIDKIYNAPWTGTDVPVAQELIIGKINNEEVLLINYRYITITWNDEMYDVKKGKYVPCDDIIYSPDNWNLDDNDSYMDSELRYKK